MHSAINYTVAFKAILVPRKERMLTDASLYDDLEMSYKRTLVFYNPGDCCKSVQVTKC